MCTSLYTFLILLRHVLLIKSSREDHNYYSGQYIILILGIVF